MVAAAARWWERAAQASWSSREYLELLVDLVRVLADLVAGEGGPEAVVDHRVDHRRVAHPGTETRLREQVGRLRHRLHPAGDDGFHLARADHLVGQRDRVEAGEADLVDGDGGDFRWDPTFDRGLAGGDLTGACLEDLAHDHVVDLRPLDPRPPQGLGDREAPEIDRLQVLERPPELADRRARSAHDHRLRHVTPPGEPPRPGTTWLCP